MELLTEFNVLHILMKTKKKYTMKKSLLPLFFSMFTIGTACSQFSMLLEAGGNYGKSSITKNEIIDHTNITSYYLAAVPKFGITKRLKVIGEIQYSLEGSQLEFVSFGFPTTSSYRQHFFRLIPGLQLKVIGPLSLIGGLNIGYAVLETWENHDGMQEVNENFRGFKKGDFGTLLGINLNVSGINIIAKYNYGFKNLSSITWTDSDGNSLDDLVVKTRFLQVGLGYEFGS